MNRICIVTDAWTPQVNGVVRSIEHTIEHLVKKGFIVNVVHPGLFKTISCPGYSEIRLALFPNVNKYLLNTNYIHIATEGPLGLAARNFCVKKKLNFNTAYHTRFPEYIEEYFNIPAKFTYPLFRWFHKPSKAVLVSTEALKSELEIKGFNNVSIWKKGVDTDFFKPLDIKEYYSFKRPIFLNVGRVSYEKNIETFLKLDLPGSKIIIGDGPAKKELMLKYPDVFFLGVKKGADLVTAYGSADVFVFPSLTDTLGLVNLEAISCGTPVVAFEQDGLKEIIHNGVNGILAKDECDFHNACLKALNLNTEDCRTNALENDWSVATDQFISNLLLK